MRKFFEGLADRWKGGWPPPWTDLGLRIGEVSKKGRQVVLKKRSTDVRFPKKVVKFFVAVNMARPPPTVSKFLNTPLAVTRTVGRAQQCKTFKKKSSTSCQNVMKNWTILTLTSVQNPATIGKKYCTLMTH
jgi:hypothetical protein